MLKKKFYLNKIINLNMMKTRSKMTLNQAMSF